MNKEYVMCGKCPIKKECHPALTPEILSDDGLRTHPVSKYDEAPVWWCRAFTCLRDGMQAAGEARQNGRVVLKTVVELSGIQRRKKVVVFGSLTKRTDIRELRVVSRRTRRIYAQGPDGRYYRAGTYVAPITI